MASLSNDFFSWPYQWFACCPIFGKPSFSGGKPEHLCHRLVASKNTLSPRAGPAFTCPLGPLLGGTMEALFLQPPYTSALIWALSVTREQNILPSSRGRRHQVHGVIAESSCSGQTRAHFTDGPYVYACFLLCPPYLHFSHLCLVPGWPFCPWPLCSRLGRNEWNPQKRLIRV